MKNIKYITPALMLAAAALVITENVVAASLAIVAAALTIATWKEKK